MCSQENARKPRIWLISLSQNATNMRKIYTPSPKLNNTCRLSGYISIANQKQSPPCVRQKITKTRKLYLLHWFKWHQNEVNQQKKPKYNHYEGCQDTSGCQMSGHCSHAFPIIGSDNSSLCVRQQTINGTNAGFLLILWNFKQLCLLRGFRMRQYNVPLQWCHNEPDGVIIHRRLDCLLDRFFFQA